MVFSCAKMFVSVPESSLSVVMPKPRPRQRSQAIDRVAQQRAGNLRLMRTVLLGTIAVALALLWLGDQYGIARDETLQYLSAALIFVLTLAVLALIGFGAVVLVRRYAARQAPTSVDPEKSDPS